MAAVAGTVHGLFSLYWAAGGQWLVTTLGEDLVTTFADKLRLGAAVLVVWGAALAVGLWQVRPPRARPDPR